jgi:hypothetical protein
VDKKQAFPVPEGNYMDVNGGVLRVKNTQKSDFSAQILKLSTRALSPYA